jgi:hypothetical protein
MSFDVEDHPAEQFFITNIEGRRISIPYILMWTPNTRIIWYCFLN